MLKPIRSWHGEGDDRELRLILPLEKVAVKYKHAVIPQTAFLDPFCADLWNKLPCEMKSVSDMWRSGRASLSAIKRGRPAARPGNSGHNWGMSIDLNLTKVIKNLGLKGSWNKKISQLRDAYAEYGWVFISPENEQWHFNGLGVNENDHRGYWSVNDWVKERWDLALTVEEIQGCLKMASKTWGDGGKKFDPGIVDGIMGRNTRGALRKFAYTIRYSVESKNLLRALIAFCAFTPILDLED